MERGATIDFGKTYKVTLTEGGRVVAVRKVRTVEQADAIAARWLGGGAA